MRVFTITAGYYEFNVWLGKKLIYTIGDVNDGSLPEPFTKNDAKREAEMMAKYLVDEFSSREYYNEHNGYTRPTLPITKGEYTHLKNECYNKIYARYID